MGRAWGRHCVGVGAKRAYFEFVLARFGGWGGVEDVDCEDLWVLEVWLAF